MAHLLLLLGCQEGKRITLSTERLPVFYAFAGLDDITDELTTITLQQPPAQKDGRWYLFGIGLSAITNLRGVRAVGSGLFFASIESVTNHSFVNRSRPRLNPAILGSSIQEAPMTPRESNGGQQLSVYVMDLETSLPVADPSDWFSSYLNYSATRAITRPPRQLTIAGGRNSETTKL